MLSINKVLFRNLINIILRILWWGFQESVLGIYIVQTNKSSHKSYDYLIYIVLNIEAICIM